TEGRIFDKSFNDSLSILLNKEAVKVFFENADPIGKKLLINTNLNGQNVSLALTIIGVVDNFNFESLHSEVTPMAIFYSKNLLIGSQNFLTIRYSGANQAELLSKVEH